jgi:hypothetical protein
MYYIVIIVERKINVHFERSKSVTFSTNRYLPTILLQKPSVEKYYYTTITTLCSGTEALKLERS